jgi:hypothetical protein
VIVDDAVDCGVEIRTARISLSTPAGGERANEGFHNLIEIM